MLREFLASTWISFDSLILIPATPVLTPLKTTADPPDHFEVTT
jgi:hypothetical protein